MVLHDGEALDAEGVLALVDAGDVGGKRVLDLDAVAGAVDSELQVVGHDERQARRELAAEIGAGEVGDVGGRAQHLVGDGGEGVGRVAAVAHEGLLDDREVVELVGHGGKADTLAEDNNLVACVGARKRDVVVDLLEDKHEKTPRGFSAEWLL